MVYKTGKWGQQAKERSKRRLGYFKQYRKNHPQTKVNLDPIKRSIRNKKYAETHRVIIHKKNDKHHKEHKDKINSAAKARYHISIPEGKICDVCKTEQAIHRHHPDYSKPLSILFVCKKCHTKLHERRKK